MREQCDYCCRLSETSKASSIARGLTCPLSLDTVKSNISDIYDKGRTPGGAWMNGNEIKAVEERV
ncbi:MAG: hypothetical protein QM233_08050, partial [Candidatus Cloacimonadota bacterium]|nr:hypothetical protein [Candidatus Cloacimonadota bacterium]